MSTHADIPSFVAPVLTQTLDEFVQQQVAEQGFANDSEYFAKLAEEEHKRKIWDYYEQECLKAIENDTWIPYTPDFFDKIEERVQQRLQTMQGEKTA